MGSVAAAKRPSLHDAAPESRFGGRRIQPFTIRLNHWMNAAFIVLMAGSGLQIFAAYPSLGPQGAQYRWYPWQGAAPAHWLRIGGWLAGGRHWHFAIAWLMVLNGLIYVAYFFGRGEWRRRLFVPARDARNAVRMLGYYLRMRKTPPPPDFYNGLQRLAYNSIVLIVTVQVLSGLAIYKPVQLHWLLALFGGYDAARAIHLLGLVLIAMFAAAHIAMVSLHPRALLAMVTGGNRG